MYGIIKPIVQSVAVQNKSRYCILLSVIHRRLVFRGRTLLYQDKSGLLEHRP